MNNPSTAVSMKFALVLITLTRTVLVANVRARVNKPHMMALKRRFMPKKNCAARIRCIALEFVTDGFDDIRLAQEPQ